MKRIIPLTPRRWLALEIFRRMKHERVEEHPLRQLFWECTLRCNVRCRHCGSDCKSSPATPDMPLQDFLKVLDSIATGIPVGHGMQRPVSHTRTASQPDPQRYA